VCVCMCVCVCVRRVYNRYFCHLILGDSRKFVVLLKTVLTFNHKTNDAIVSKINHKFIQNCVLLIWG